jgi:uncharacterized protein YegP (UPF0339 family)
VKKIIRSLLLPLALAGAVGLACLDSATAQDKKDKKAAPAATAVFELYKDSGDKFRFRLKDGEGELLAMSTKGYDTKAECQKVIEAVKSCAAKAKVHDDTKK